MTLTTTTITTVLIRQKRRRNGKVGTYDNKNNDENAIYDCIEDKNVNDNDISDGTTMTNSTTGGNKERRQNGKVGREKYDNADKINRDDDNSGKTT